MSRCPPPERYSHSFGSSSGVLCILILAESPQHYKKLPSDMQACCNYRIPNKKRQLAEPQGPSAHRDIHSVCRFGKKAGCKAGSTYASFPCTTILHGLRLYRKVGLDFFSCFGSGSPPGLSTIGLDIARLAEKTKANTRKCGYE